MIYANRPVRFLLQITADAFALAWIALWVWAALTLHEIVMAFAEPGVLLEDAGGGLTANMKKAAESVRDVPLAGDRLAKPFTTVGATGKDLTEAGQGFQDSVANMAFWLALVTVAVPVALILMTWLPARLRWIAQASSTRRIRTMKPDAAAELLALRAMSNARINRLTAVHADPVGAWRKGDAGTVERLAKLELRRLGLRA